MEGLNIKLVHGYDANAEMERTLFKKRNEIFLFSEKWGMGGLFYCCVDTVTPFNNSLQSFMSFCVGMVRLWRLENIYDFSR